MSNEEQPNLFDVPSVSNEEQLVQIYERLGSIYELLDGSLVILVGVLKFLCGITILCLQDASLLSFNSIVPAGLMLFGWLYVWGYVSQYPT